MSTGRLSRVVLFVTALLLMSTWATAISPGDSASVNGWIVTSIIYGNDGRQIGFTAEDADRHAGIRVVSNTPVRIGDRVSANGRIMEDRKERVLRADAIVASKGKYNVEPFVMRVRDTGGGKSDLQEAVVNDATMSWSQSSRKAKGLNNVGLLVTLRGKVTGAVDTGTYDGYFYIDDEGEAVSADGAVCELGVRDGSGFRGMRCRPAPNADGTPGALPREGEYVEVTGVIGVEDINGENARYLWTRSWSPAKFEEVSIPIAEGWNLLSLPAQPVNPDPAAVFADFNIDYYLYAWDASTQSMTAYDSFAPDWFGGLSSSTGYWLISDRSGTVTYTAYADPPGHDRWLPLREGWNIIGMPFKHKTWWDDWKATDGLGMKSIQTARGDMLHSAIFGFDKYMQCLVEVGLHCDQALLEDMEPGCGYWVRATRDIALVAPADSIAP